MTKEIISVFVPGDERDTFTVDTPKHSFSFHDGEPEDNIIGRNFNDILSIPQALEEAYELGRSGVEVKFTNIDVQGRVETEWYEEGLDLVRGKALLNSVRAGAPLINNFGSVFGGITYKEAVNERVISVVSSEILWIQEGTILNREIVEVLGAYFEVLFYSYTTSDVETNYSYKEVEKKQKTVDVYE